MEGLAGRGLNVFDEKRVRGHRIVKDDVEAGPYAGMPASAQDSFELFFSECSTRRVFDAERALAQL